MAVDFESKRVYFQEGKVKELSVTKHKRRQSISIYLKIFCSFVTAGLTLADDGHNSNNETFSPDNINMSTTETTLLCIIAAAECLTSLYALFVFCTILATKKTRAIGFNIYIAFLLLPDALLNCALGCHNFLWVSGDFCSYNKIPLLIFCFYMLNSFYLNAVVAFEVYNLAWRSFMREKATPLSLRRVYSQIMFEYLFAAMLTVAHNIVKKDLNPCSRSDSMLNANSSTGWIFYSISLPPIVYVIYVKFRTWHKELLPVGNKTRAVNIYFSRIIIVFVAFYIPMLGLGKALTHIGSAKKVNEASFLYYMLGVNILVMLQCQVSLSIFKTKGDVIQATRRSSTILNPFLTLQPVKVNSEAICDNLCKAGDNTHSDLDIKRDKSGV